MEKFQNIWILILLLGGYSCTSVSEDDLIDKTPIEEVITYNNHVKTIIESNCVSCHSMPPENGAPMPLVSYSDVRNAVINRGLLDRISSENLGFLMPFGGPRLPQNLIDIVFQWEIDGLLEE